MAEPVNVTKAGGGGTTVKRTGSILGMTFRRNRYINGSDISRPISLRHTAHVGATGHNFGDLSFLEPGGTKSKSNGLECSLDYDSPVLRKAESINSVPDLRVDSRSSVGITSDSGNGSELGATDKSLTEDDLSSLSESEIIEQPEYFCDFQVDLGPSLLDDVMNTIKKMEKKKSRKPKIQKKKN